MAVLPNSKKELGMDSAELKKVIIAVHGSSIALDEEDKKGRKMRVIKSLMLRMRS